MGYPIIIALCALFTGFPVAGAMIDDPSSTAFLTTPVAKFTDLKSTATEQHGDIKLEVAFSHEFAGRLTYSVAGTAERGMDFDLSESTVETGGLVHDVDIVLNLRDDALVEDVETIQVTLLPGEGYRLGSARQHTVGIQDNDANWRVMNDVDGMRFDYGMRIIRNGGSTAATVTSDGGNGLPAGTYPVNLRSADDGRFEAIVGPVTVPAGRTLLGAELARTFKLIADPSKNNSHEVDHERLLIGAATETWTSEGASHLTRGEPISGTFLMSRIIGGATSEETRGERSKGATQDDKVGARPGAESECEVADMSGTSSYAVMPGRPGSQALRNPEMAWAGQPFVAAHIPYPNFITETLEEAREALYYDKAPTQEAKNLAAFRYRTLLYEKEEAGAETYIRAQFDEIDDLWSCAERERAHQAARTVIDALRYAPWNRELRWALLDIHYDIAVAEKALAQERHVAVAKLMLGEPAPGEFLINEEIVALEKALPLYRNALAGYMKVMQAASGIDVADFETDSQAGDEPYGYYIFREEVPSRSPLAAVFKRTNGKWVSPVEAKADDERPSLFEGYKDVTLLFELLRDYLRTAEQLSKRYWMRGEPSDLERAEGVIGAALLSTYLEGHALLAMFPEIREQDGKVDFRSGLREAVAGWRHSYSALGHIRSALTGDTNILGFKENFLALVQSVVPGEKSQTFHSFDAIKDYMERGPLERAKNDLMEARASVDHYGTRSDRLAVELADRNEQYDDRLKKIVGVGPDEHGYDDPSNNDGEIARQLLNIERARNDIARAGRRIGNLEEKINIETERRGQEAGIHNAISKIYIDYGNKQADLTEEIAAINSKQAFWNNMMSGLIGASTAATMGLTGGAAAIPLIAGGSALYQANKEQEKGELQASKERLAALEKAEVLSQNDKLLDVNSKAYIKGILLDMKVVQIDSARAMIDLQRELKQLSALYVEKQDLERRKAESEEGLAERYFADPSHRLLKDASLLRSESSFANAQRWLFFAIRAAEYKWNQKFEYTDDRGKPYTTQALFRTRNAQELSVLSDALAEWDKRMWFGTRNDDGYKAFSIRKDFLDHDLDAFRSFINNGDNHLYPEDPENEIPGFKVLRLRFNTAFTPNTGNIFMRNRWLEKINFLRVMLVGGNVRGFDRTIPGYLVYGGVSLIRNQIPGTPDPDDPARLVNETTPYVMSQWYYRDDQWRSKEAFSMPIDVEVAQNPRDVPEDVRRINTFKELSVAATDWTLLLAIEKDGTQLVDLSDLTDIEFHIHYFWYARQR